MDGIEVPEYFICPISLQIMKDPVTVITGITYDRESIEHWLLSCKIATCPLTKQPLPINSELTPNHTLRRLIQAWCTENASNGVDRIPSPKQRLDKIQVLKLVTDLEKPELKMKTLKQLELLAVKNERNRECLAEAGASKAVILFFLWCYERGQIFGLAEALSILYLIRIPSQDFALIPRHDHDRIINSLIWVLESEVDSNNFMKTQAVIVLKKIIDAANTHLLERLKLNFFKVMIGLFREKTATHKVINAALHVMLKASNLGKNRTMMVEAGAVFELIEIALGSCEKKITELVFSILANLCSCADGRDRFMSHKGGIAVVAKRIMRVSAAVDDRGLLILSLMCKYSSNGGVFQEMLNVGAVSKLCMLLQAGSAGYLKEKARDILRSHADKWKNNSCINPSTITMHLR